MVMSIMHLLVISLISVQHVCPAFHTSQRCNEQIQIKRKISKGVRDCMMVLQCLCLIGLQSSTHRVHIGLKFKKVIRIFLFLAMGCCRPIDRGPRWKSLAPLFRFQRLVASSSRSSPQITHSLSPRAINAPSFFQLLSG